MGEKTGIEWTDSTWTPIRARYWEIQDDGSAKERKGWHCEHVSEGCRNCYSETLNRRIGTGLDFKPGELFREDRVGYHNGESRLFLDDHMLLQPLRWKRPRMIFVCSMTDLFASFVPDEWIDRMFAVMAMAPQHRYQVLTKRSERMRAYMTELKTSARWLFWKHPLHGGDAFCPYSAQFDCAFAHIWLGVSAEDQKAADARIPDLLATPAAVRFVSAEPLLGPIDLTLDGLSCWPCANCSDVTLIEWDTGANVCRRCDGSGKSDEVGLDWVIVGGESGPNARPFPVSAARDVLIQCRKAGVPAFMKQMGAKPVFGTIPAKLKHVKGADPQEWPIDLRVQQMPGGFA